MFEIFGRGRYANLFLNKANELCNKQRSSINSTSDQTNVSYVIGNLKFADSSQIIKNYSVNINDNLTNKGQVMAYANAGFYQFPVGAKISLYDTGTLRPPYYKILLNYETFKSYKERMSPTANYFKPYNLTGQLPGMRNEAALQSIMNSLVVPYKVPWSDFYVDPELNYRLNHKYDDYIIITGIQFYDEDKSLSTSRLIFSCKLDFENLLISKRNGNLLPPVRNLAPFEGNKGIPSLNPVNDIIPNSAGGGSGEFNFFADSITPYTFTFDPNPNSSFYNFSVIPAIDSPFVCMSSTTNIEYLNAIYLTLDDSSPSLYNLRLMSGFTLAPTIQDFVNYFSDWGFEVYLSIDDLLEDNPVEDTEEENPDFGYTPPDDPIGIPDNSVDDPTPINPTITPATLTKTYCLNFSSFQEFNGWISSTDFLEALKKYYQDPMDGVLSLKLYPFDFLKHDPNYLLAQDDITIVSQSHDISCYIFTRQYNFFFNGGSYYYQPYYGDFNDYLAGYSIYIPYIGSITLDPAEVINKTLRITYGIDILSGQCEALLYSNNVLIRTLTGICGLDLPLTGTNYTQSVRNAVNYAVGLGTSIASAAITGIPALQFAGMGASTITSMELAEQKAQSQFASRLGAGVGVNAAVEGTKTLLQSLPNNQQQTQTKSSPCTALLAPQVPYLSIVLPQPIYPENRQQLEGYNASMTRKIGTMEGYCKGTPYGDWDISGATLQEINMIKQIIQGGFYI